MNIERAAEEHIMGQGKVDEIKITIANNGYIIEYEWFLENVKKRNIKKVLSSLEDALDNVKKICNNYPLSF